jgi:hypothetical protein
VAPTRATPRRSAIALFERVFHKVTRRGQPPPWAELRLDGLSEPALAAARATWGARASGEYQTMALFGRLATNAAAAGLPLDLTVTLTRLMQDEARHAELCAELCERMGGPGTIAIVPDDPALRDSAVSPHLYFAYYAVGMFCIGESCSAANMRATVGPETDPCVAAVYETLLSDEVLHQLFGWALAERLVPQLSSDERDWLGASLTRPFRTFERAHALFEDAPVPAEDGGSPALRRMGLLPAETSARAFYAVVNDVVLPRLDALGVPAYEAWELRNEAPEG